MKSAISANTRPVSGALLPDLDALTCEWDRDLHAVGAETGLPPAFRIGVSVLALAMLAGAALVAIMASDAGAGLDVAGLVLVAAAGFPWARWALRDDNGPSWSFAALVLAPLVALGAGRWSAAPIGLGSDPAYYMATFPALLLVLLYGAFAPARLAVGVVIAAYAAFGVPLLAGWAVEGRSPDWTGALVWQAGFALCVIAGYAVRLSYIVNVKIGEAREALAWQAAAEQRRRVAQDVHDVVAHTLAITMLHITAARMAVRRSSPAEAEEALEEAERHGRASLNDIRRIVRLLRSEDATAVDPAQPGLADVEALAAGYRAAGLPVDLSLAIDDRRTSPAAELALYRVLQEALTNAARHGSGPATVDLRVRGGEMALNVDNPVDHLPARPSQGSGLLGMRERIAAAGGTIEAGVQNGRWIVRAIVPGGAIA